MKLAISSQGDNLEASVDPRFGRASNFIMFDLETQDFEVIENKQNLNLPQGAGIQAGKTIVDNGADVLITGNCGPKAFNVLSTAGVKVYTGAKGTIKETINHFNDGKLQLADSPNVEGHWV